MRWAEKSGSQQIFTEPFSDKKHQIYILLSSLLIGLFPFSLSYAQKNCTAKQILSARGYTPSLTIRLCGRDPGLLNEVGIKLIRLGRNKDALPWIKKSVELSPDNTDYLSDYIVLMSWLVSIQHWISS